MTRLADALEAMHAADDRWSSIQADGIEWTDYQLRYSAATQEMHRRGGRQSSSVGGSFTPVFGRYKPEASRPQRAEATWHAWMRSPTEFRAELNLPPMPSVTQIVRNETWWSWMQGQEVTSNLGDEKHGAGTLILALNLLRPSVLLPHAEFDFVRRTTTLGRAAFLLESRRIPNQRGVGAMVSAGLLGDKARVVVDADRGVVLRLESWHSNSLLHRVVVKRIAFDEDFDQTLLEPPGQAVDRSKRSVTQRHHYWQLDQLAGQAPHPVFVPDGLEYQIDNFPGLWFHGVSADIDEGDPEKGAKPSVTLHYSISHGGRNGTLWIQESRSPYVYDAGEPWSTVDGIQVRQRPKPQARLEIDGVHIHMECAIYSPEKLVEVARSLKPLPAEPPPLVTVRST